MALRQFFHLSKAMLSVVQPVVLALVKHSFIFSGPIRLKTSGFFVELLKKDDIFTEIFIFFLFLSGLLEEKMTKER